RAALGKSRLYIFADAQFFDHVVKTGAAHTQFLGGWSDAAGVAAQGALDHVALQSFARFFERHDRRGCPRQFQVARSEALAFGHDDSAPDAVFHFADVARPRIPG